MQEFDVGLAAYQQTTTHAQAATADPHKLVVMLIDGFLDEMARVEGHMKAERYMHKGKSISKCIEILSGLDSALDLQQGGQVADNLHNLYDYCAQTLFQASVDNDPSQLPAITNVMENLREGWLMIGSKAS
ncbi:flagellar export chaperone FliS [Thalassotalea sp. PLHSN55]|uniref:flagellar export chaperone FliS n=1 Tax=Thalassotalea sp. PLHSN55 TaxID=3435888 RepID=UPI003F850C2A